MADIIQDSDQFLVNRSDTVQTVSAENLMATIEDTDLMIINRSDQVYTVTGEDVKDSLGGGGKEIDPSPGDITADPNFEGGTGTEADPYILKSIEVNPAGASGQSVELITVAVAEASEYDLVVWKDNSTGAGDRFTQPAGVVDADGKWTGRLVYKDEPDTATDTTYTGDLQLGTTYFRWSVVQKLVSNSAPIIKSAVLTETNPAKGNRFTSQSFAYNVTMLNNGFPASEKQIDAYVEGSIATSFTSDEITDVVEDPTPFEQAIEYPDPPGYIPDYTYGIAFDGTDKWMSLVGYGAKGNCVIMGTGASTPTWGTSILDVNSLGYAGGNFYTVKSDRNGRWIVFGYVNSENLFRYSDDHGQTWTTATISGGMPSAAYPLWCRSVATDYEGRWVVVGGDGAQQNQYVFTSTDNGTTWEWQLFSPGAPTGGNIQSCAFVDNTIVVSNAQGGLYYVSEDFGTTWGTATAAPGLGGFYAIAVSSDSKVFVGATITGPKTICRSVDLGASWQEINTTDKVTGCIPLGGGVWLALGDKRSFSLSFDDCLTFGTFTNFTNNPDQVSNTFVYDLGPGGTVLLPGIRSSGYPCIKVIAGSQVELTVDGEKDLAFIEGVVTNGKPDGDPDLAIGSVNDINIDGTNSTIKLVNTTGTWATGQVVKTAPVTSDNTKLYVAFDSAGTVSDLSSTPKSYLTTDDPVNLVLTFPATFPSGNTPDEELPEGTTLTATVIASNSEGSSVGVSTVQPIINEGPSTLPASQFAGYDWRAGYSVTKVTNGVTAKFVNVASNYISCFGLSEDNELYAFDYVPLTTFAPRLLGSFVDSIGADREVAQACCGYNGSMVLLTTDGVLYRFARDASYEPNPADLIQTKAGLDIAGLTAFTAISDADLCWSNKTKHCYSGSGIDTLANITSVPGDFTQHVPLDNITFGLNPGVDIRQITGSGVNYSEIPYLYVLFADGKLFINGSPMGTGYVQMFARGGSGQTGVMLLKDDGTIWEQSVGGAAAVQYDSSRTYLTAPCGYGTQAYIAVDSTGQWRNIPISASTPSNVVLGLSQVTGNVTRQDLDGWGTNVNHMANGEYVVIPVLDGTRSSKNMEPDTLLETKARFATYENRADVYQGQQAQQKRDDLNSQIAANLGISIAELKELVGEED